MALLRGLLSGLVGVVLAGCSMPALTSDGQFVWTPGAKRGASVLTANGVEFLDRRDTPQPTARKSPYEPYRPVTGFLVPTDGRWHRTAQPVHFRAEQLAVTLRTSDALVPSWGGELLVELELSSRDTATTLAARRGKTTERGALGALPVAVREEDPGRPPLRLLLVVDDVSSATAELVCAALSSLSGDDQVAVVDTRGAQVLTPFLPYGHRSLIEGALRRRVAMRPPGSSGRDLPGALGLARGWLDREPAAGATTAVLVVTDGATLDQDSAAVQERVRGLSEAGVRVAAAGPAELVGRGKLKAFQGDQEPETLHDSRRAALDQVLPAPQGLSLRDFKVVVSSSPAPAHVIETTAGKTGALLDEDELYLDGLAAGEVRTELIRVSIPPFVPGESYRLTLRFEGRDAISGATVTASHRLLLRYTDDVEALARERSGDVFAYASALTLVQRLDRGLFGETTAQPGGLQRLVDWQQGALGQLAQQTGDASLERRARLLQTLAWATDLAIGSTRARFSHPHSANAAPRRQRRGRAGSGERKGRNAPCEPATKVHPRGTMSDAPKLPSWVEAARATWTWRGARRPPFAIPPGPDQESVWDYPRPPLLVPDTRRVEVRSGEILIASTTVAFRLLETSHPPTFYLPLADVDTSRLSRVAGGSFCEWKGQAVYFDLILGERRLPRAAWAYPDPIEERFQELAHRVAFYATHLDCLVDGAQARPQAGGFYGGWITPELTGPFKGDPATSGWLLQGGAPTLRGTVRGLLVGLGLLLAGCPAPDAPAPPRAAPLPLRRSEVARAQRHGAPSKVRHDRGAIMPPSAT